MTELYNDTDCYILWLSGYSLRQLGRRYGVDFTTIRRRLIRAYGAKAVNPRANSLTRSLIVDYQGNTEVQRWALFQHQTDEYSDRHRSNHSLDMLSKYTVVHEPELMDLFAVHYDPLDESEYDEPMRLPLLIAVLQAVVSIIFCEALEAVDSAGGG